MSSAAIRDHTGRSYIPPTNIQFSVFLDNRVGKLLEILDIFHEQTPRIVGLSIMDSTDYAVVRLLTSNADEARKLLRDAGVAFSEADLLAVRLTHNRTMADLCRCLLTAELSIHYAYPLMLLNKAEPAIAIHTDDRVIACELLWKKDFDLLGEADLQ